MGCGGQRRCPQPSRGRFTSPCGGLHLPYGVAGCPPPNTIPFSREPTQKHSWRSVQTLKCPGDPYTYINLALFNIGIQAWTSDLRMQAIFALRGWGSSILLRRGLHPSYSGDGDTWNIALSNLGRNNRRIYQLFHNFCNLPAKINT